MPGDNPNIRMDAPIFAARRMEDGRLYVPLERAEHLLRMKDWHAAILEDQLRDFDPFYPRVEAK